MVAIFTWKRELRHQRVVIFIDNNSARQAVIRGYSLVAILADVIHQVGELESELGLFTWFARVPAISNPGDAPSRLDWTAVRDLGARRVDVVLPGYWPR